MRHADEHRLVVVRGHEVHGFPGQLQSALGVGLGGHGVQGPVLTSGVEAPLGGAFADVPFAQPGGGIAFFLQKLAEGGDLFGEGARALAFAHLRVGVGRGGDVGQARPRGVLSAQEAAAGGRADMRGGIGVGEPKALTGHSIDMRSAVQIAAVAAQVHVAHVVDKDEDDVGLLRRGDFFCGLG